MGFLDGKFSVFSLSAKKRSAQAECPRTVGPSRKHQRRRIRERRYHIHPQALGLGGAEYASVMPSSEPGPEAPPVAGDAAETLSDLEVVRQLPRKGMRICAWILGVALVVIYFKQIVAILLLAAQAWPGFD